MKQFLISALILLIVVLAKAGTIKTNAVLAWDYSTNELSTNFVFILYSSTNISIPTTNWMRVTNVVGTNLTLSIPISSGNHFYILTASNEWGESDPSNVASAQVPSRGNNLRVSP